jgi:uracil-DNA glycosylase
MKSLDATMPDEYLALAAKRVAKNCSPHQQPEDLGFDFRTWISPYTKGAHSLGGIAVVLQDWASSNGLINADKPLINAYGRTPDLLTNKRLEKLLKVVFNLELAGVYVTNIYPFVKSGGMSSPLRIGLVREAARELAIPELQIVKPTLVLALGKNAEAILRYFGVKCVGLPHPAARIGNTESHERIWRLSLQGAGVDLAKN